MMTYRSLAGNTKRTLVMHQVRFAADRRWICERQGSIRQNSQTGPGGAQQLWRSVQPGSCLCVHGWWWWVERRRLWQLLAGVSAANCKMAEECSVGSPARNSLDAGLTPNPLSNPRQV